MAEEHRCQALKLCANNCGFFGSPATQNLCSKCYRDLQLKELQSSNALLVLNQSLTATTNSSSTAEAEALAFSSSTAAVAAAAAAAAGSSFLPEPSASMAVPAGEMKEEARMGTANRCGNCRRRVGLTGFKCRCGITFCGTHRYPEQHGCGFDFKALGREEIKKANPVIKAEKLDKI